jgi:hypothetical protein
MADAALMMCSIWRRCMLLFPFKQKLPSFLWLQHTGKWGGLTHGCGVLRIFNRKAQHMFFTLVKQGLPCIDVGHGARAHAASPACKVVGHARHQLWLLPNFLYRQSVHGEAASIKDCVIHAAPSFPAQAQGSL